MRDPTDLAARRKLAMLAAEANEWTALERWAWETALVKPTDPQAYEWLRKAYLQLDKPAQAARATYALALLDSTQRIDRMLEAAELFRRAGEVAEARRIVDEVLRQQPEDARARKLHAELGQDGDEAGDERRR